MTNNLVRDFTVDFDHRMVSSVQAAAPAYQHKDKAQDCRNKSYQRVKEKDTDFVLNFSCQES